MEFLLAFCAIVAIISIIIAINTQKTPEEKEQEEREGKIRSAYFYSNARLLGITFDNFRRYFILFQDMQNIDRSILSEVVIDYIIKEQREDYLAKKGEYEEVLIEKILNSKF